MVAWRDSACDLQVYRLVVAVVALSIGCWYFELGLDALPLAAAWTALCGAMLLAAMMLIQLFAASQRGGNILTMGIVFPLMMIGGSFFPLEAMPSWMATVGAHTPNGWALVQLKRILFERNGLVSLGPALLAVVVVGTALFATCAYRLRNGFAQG